MLRTKMNLLCSTIALLFLINACNNSKGKQADAENPQKRFDKIKWSTKVDDTYPYRDAMLADLIANVKLNGSKYADVINLLGQPDRIDNGHLFYKVTKDNLGNTAVVLHTKTLVIKLTKDSIVEWRKIHE